MVKCFRSGPRNLVDEVRELARQHQNLSPGTPAPVSGIYQEVGPRGGKHNEVTVPKGKTLPPTPTKGGTYDLVERAHNKSGRG
jgi:hypothetical protein